eukprot:TRINITY_DN4877_c0_g1_i1.p1 TRINITY_DN4877_c0_g1~~TRINITY_DN4877_c0_g1_i1.p1  ORF type:complete len:416 (+),score=149.29 TRINITY_DN4877_c0_g1_i1:63-1310(+)
MFTSFRVNPSLFSKRNFSTSMNPNNKDVVILSAVRTPIGAFNGSLSSLSAPELGAVAIKGAMEKIKLSPKEVQEVYFGHVLQGGVGQAPARQALVKAGIPYSCEATTINKVCASGMKAVAMAAQNIMLQQRDLMIAGGMESMSNTPYYVPNARQGLRYGNGKLEDGVLKDGLWDPYHDQHMGNCGEKCAKDYSISRQEQDNFAIETYKRASEAWKSGFFKDEVVPVTIQKKGETIVISEDEGIKSIKLDKVPTLKPAFDKNGSITAANSSPLNDGASALVLASSQKAQQLGIKPIGRILGFADFAQEPQDFTTAPSKAIPIALERAGLKLSDIDYFEINQAFSVVSIANAKILGLDYNKLDVNGGAVALGHALGSSGSRIIVTLLHTLRARNGKYGVAAICNGGGGASAIVVERL